MHLKGEKCSGGKHSKFCLTGLVAGNAHGERLPMFVIGKANKLRCFQDVRNLPCRYRAQRKSWMTAEFFEEWVRQLDRKFSAANRKIALIIDSLKAHPHIEQRNSIELTFLPPNTTSHTQPMDQGIICDLKAKYRSLAVRKLIAAVEKKNPVPTISIFSAMPMLEKECDAVSNKTFTNCFKKAGISEKEVLNDEYDPFAGFSKFGETMLKSLKELNRGLDREELSHKKHSVITSFFKAIDLSSEKNVFSYV